MAPPRAVRNPGPRCQNFHRISCISRRPSNSWHAMSTHLHSGTGCARRRLAIQRHRRALGRVPESASLYLDTLCLPLNIYVPDQAPRLTHLHCASWGAWRPMTLWLSTLSPTSASTCHTTTRSAFVEAASSAMEEIAASHPLGNWMRPAHPRIRIARHYVFHTRHPGSTRNGHARCDSLVLFRRLPCLRGLQESVRSRLCVLITQGRPTNISSVKEVGRRRQRGPYSLGQALRRW